MRLPRLVDQGRGIVLARLVGNGVAQALVTVATLLLTRALFDRVIGESADGAGLAKISAGLGGLVIVAVALVALERIDAERLGQAYARCVRIRLFERLTRLAPRSLQRHSRGSIVLRFVGDLTALRQWLSLGLARLAVTGVVIGATLFALAAMSPLLAAVVAAVLAGGTGLSFATSRPLGAATAEARRRSAHLAANVNEKVASMPVVQVHRQIRREQKRLERQSRRLENAMVSRARWIGALRALGEATGRLASVAVLLAGAWAVRAGDATPGTIVAAAAVVGLLSPSIRDLGRVFEMWSKARVARTKLEAFLKAPRVELRTRGNAKLASGPGDIAFDNVSFGVLRDFSATASGGQRIAIVGPNGAGKSTLLWLAARLMDPESGRVLLDGQDVRTLSLGSLRRAIGIVAPGLPLLRGSVADNVAYRWPKAAAADIERTYSLAGLDAVAADLPHGLETKLVDEGANLSEGQRQRIMLARALLGSPRLLLLDELEANLDPRSRAATDDALRGYQGTVLLVTHEIARVESADIVWHLEDGRLVESGPPRDVLASGGRTSALFDRRRRAV